MNRARQLRFRAPRVASASRSGGDERGVTALEFALVAPPLLFLMFAILEVGLVMHVSSKLENATHRAARLGSTGNTYDDLNVEGLSRGDFLRKVVADELGGWVEEPSQLVVTATEVGDIGNFATVNEEIDPEEYDLGEAGSAVLYRVIYRYRVMTPLAGPMLSEDGVIELVASAPVVNEEFCGRRRCGHR